MDGDGVGHASRCGRDTTVARRTHLLHDAGLPLGEGDVTTRLVLDELDLNLATLAAGLVVVIVVVVGGGAGALALDAAVLGPAIVEVVVFLVVVGGILDQLGRHDGLCTDDYCFRSGRVTLSGRVGG